MARTQDDAHPDAIDMLIEDHKRVQRLFRDFEKGDREDEEALRELVETACMELQIHSMLEEEIFYPAVRGQPSGRNMEERLNRAEVEHEVADELIAKLLNLTTEDAMYTAYFDVLAETVKHHMREEEKDLFPEVRKSAALDLKALGEAMLQRRQELFAQIESEDADESEDELDTDPEAESEGEDDLESAPDVSDFADAVEDEMGDEQETLDPRRTRH